MRENASRLVVLTAVIRQMVARSCASDIAVGTGEGTGFGAPYLRDLKRVWPLFDDIDIRGGAARSCAARLASPEPGRGICPATSNIMRRSHPLKHAGVVFNNVKSPSLSITLHAAWSPDPTHPGLIRCMELLRTSAAGNGSTV